MRLDRIAVTGLGERDVEPDRGPALTIDGGWREVAEAALKFVKQFA